MSVAKAARQASFRPTCSPNRGWIILFEPPPSPLSAPAPPSLPLSSSSSSSSQELWRIFFYSFFFLKNKICFLLGKKRQPWDALPPGWDGFMMCCQLAEGARERMRKHSKHVFLLPTIIWGEEGRKKRELSWVLFHNLSHGKKWEEENILMVRWVYCSRVKDVSLLILWAKKKKNCEAFYSSVWELKLKIV